MYDSEASAAARGDQKHAAGEIKGECRAVDDGYLATSLSDWQQIYDASDVGSVRAQIRGARIAEYSSAAGQSLNPHSSSLVHLSQ